MTMTKLANSLLKAKALAKSVLKLSKRWRLLHSQI